MNDIAVFQLPKWIEGQSGDASLILAGSATPGQSIEELINLSSEKDVTARNLSLNTVKLSGGAPEGSERLRSRIAALYNKNITAANVHTAGGTTGANSLAFMSLLKSGDHVISMYPTYAQLWAQPRAIVGVEMSYWSVDLQNEGRIDIQALKDMIKPETQMIILNNPNNPTGTLIGPELQSEIVSVAKQHNLILFVDEIFRPLFHDKNNPPPPSFLDVPDDYENIIVTGSLSKAWGLSGIRAGWLATRNLTFWNKCCETGWYTIQSMSALDEVVASEALSDRVRPQILAKHLGYAQKNLDLLQKLIDDNQDSCSWIRPTAGATAFVRFSTNGTPVDDVDFCLRLKKEKGVLLSPGSLCFGTPGRDDLQGYTRVHITVPPEIMKEALHRLQSFLRP